MSGAIELVCRKEMRVKPRRMNVFTRKKKGKCGMPASIAMGDLG
jgi:hypothetical protein